MQLYRISMSWVYDRGDMTVETGKRIHHVLCGHGGELGIQDSEGQPVCHVDGYEPIHQYYGCKWHVSTYLKNENNEDKNR